MSVTAPDPTVSKVKKLVEEHRQLRDEPLLLAVLFVPNRNPGDLFLFEVVDNFGAGHIDEDKELFEVSYSSTPSFPLLPGQQLRLVLTSPEEFDAAAQEHWPSFEEIRAAIKNGSAQTLFSDPARPDLEAKLNG